MKLPAVNRGTLVANINAGLIVGVIALPLCIAFAIASGVSPDKGIFTAVIGGALIAVLSGSKIQIGGPSGPFVVIAFSVVAVHGVNGLLVATFMAGVILILMGQFKFGSLIKFIPYPVTTGFTSAVAIMLVTTEFGDLLGLSGMAATGSIVQRWQSYFAALNSINIYAVAISVGTVLLHLAVSKPWIRLPASLVALMVSTAAVTIFQLPVETIGSRFPDLTFGLPTPVLPELSFDLIRAMVSPAIAIALLVAMEALLSAVVADGMSGNVHDPNRVISAHGIANLATAAFGCLPATAAIARTATNVRSGATSALSGLTHSVLLLLILVFLGRWAALIPLSCLAAILVVVAYHLLDWRSLRALLKSPRSDIAVLFTTMGITLFVDLATGIQVGVALAGALFIQRMSDVTDVNVVSKQFLSDRNISWAAPPSGDLPKGIDVYEINGPFFFGAVYKLREALHAVRKAPMVRILRMAKVSAMDSTGLHALEELWALSKKQKTTLIISEIHAQPFIALTKSDLIAKFGEQNVLATYELAIARARELIQARSTV